MQIKNIMTKSVKYIDPNLTLTEAAKIMLEKDIGTLPVGKNDRLTGMITDRNISIRAIAKGLNPQSTTVKEAMTSHCLYGFEDDSVEDAARNMGKNQIRPSPCY